MFQSTKIFVWLSDLSDRCRGKKKKTHVAGKVPTDNTYATAKMHRLFQLTLTLTYAGNAPFWFDFLWWNIIAYCFISNFASCIVLLQNKHISDLNINCLEKSCVQ